MEKATTDVDIDTQKKIAEDRRNGMSIWNLHSKYFTLSLTTREIDKILRRHNGTVH